MGSDWRKRSPSCTSSRPTCSFKAPSPGRLSLPVCPLCSPACCLTAGPCSPALCSPTAAFPSSSHSLECSASPLDPHVSLAARPSFCGGHPQMHCSSYSPSNSTTLNARGFRGWVGLLSWPGASCSPEPIPGSGFQLGWPIRILTSPLAATDPLPAGRGPAHFLACHEHCQQERRKHCIQPRRCSARLFPSGDSAAHNRPLSIVLLPDPQLPSPTLQKLAGERGKLGEARERTKRGGETEGPALPGTGHLNALSP